jgi:transmembrane sensor
MVSEVYIKELLQRYKEGRCTPEEIIRLEQWFELVQCESDNSSELTKKDEDRLIRRLRESPRFCAPITYTSKKTNTVLFRRFLQVAAAAAVLIVLGNIIFFQRNERGFSNTVGESLITCNTGIGEIKEIILPDSSHIWLNARSAISYPKIFQGKLRKVKLLQGQAFFSITPDSRRPFIVQSQQNVQIRVLGTSFAVANDSSTAVIQVAVRTGKVSLVQHEKTLSTLSSGEQADYDTRQSVVRLSQADPLAIGDWTSGEIKLKQADFLTMAKLMQQMYGIRVVAGNTAVSHNQYSLTICYGIDRQQLLEVISGINGNSCEWKNKDSTLVIIQ